LAFTFGWTSVRLTIKKNTGRAYWTFVVLFEPSAAHAPAANQKSVGFTTKLPELAGKQGAKTFGS
jgi:hypothetical protein